MTVDVTETVLDCVRGDDNIYDVDLDSAIVGASDKFWFFAKRRLSDSDDDAVIKKGLNATGLTGIVLVSNPNGQVQIQLDGDDTASLEDKALHYDVQYQSSTGGKIRTVARGVLLLSGEVTRATS